MAEVKPAIETFAKIKVIGVGGSGGSAVNRMIKSKIKGVEFISANTDVQALAGSAASTKLALGKTVTRGLGAGMDPEKGKLSAEESINEIKEAIKGADMVFVTCGLGGGTGSGAAPVIAEAARDQGSLTIGVVTRPFGFEGKQRSEIAERAYAALASHVDAIISIPNDRILQVIDKKATLLDAFEKVDDVLHQGVQGISQVITVPGLINVDFADVKAIMSGTGSALMGIGVGTGDNRATDAAKQAVDSPLLDISIEGAKGILFTVTGGTSLGMLELAEAAKVITANADPNAKVIFGATIDEDLKDEVRVCVIATGFMPEEKPTAADKKQAQYAPNYSPNAFLKKEELTQKPLPVAKEPERAVAEESAPAAMAEPAVAEMPEFEPVEETMPAPIAKAEPTPAPKAKVTARPVATEPENDLDDNPFVKKAVRASVKEPVRQMQPATAASDSEEDLEIPAFLRRKLGQRP
jgi:cell division protein FtsZ